LGFAYGPNGKPALADNLQKQLSFNVSHAGGLAVYAFASGFNVGVDIEEVHPISDLEITASLFLNPDELDEIKGLPNSKKLEHFFKFWTCKEAILKALGTGFTGPVHDILATFYQPDLKGKRLMLLNPAKGYTGALACL
jgi:4'-phosphopantetheinyl transferase